MSISISSSLQNSSIEAYYLNEKIQKEEENENTMKADGEMVEEVALSPQGDLLEISAAGRAASENGASADEASGSAAQYSASSVESNAQAATQMLEEAETEETEESSTTDLSSYSDSELREMYQDGEITAAQYSQEMSRRKLEEAEADTQTGSALTSTLLDELEEEE